MDIMVIGEIILKITEVIILPVFALVASSSWWISMKDRKKRIEVELEMTRQSLELRDEQKRQEAFILAQQEGTKALIREAIVNRHKESVHSGYMDVNQRESLSKLYDAYKGMDGNGMVDILYGEMSDPGNVTTRHS